MNGREASAGAASLQARGRDAVRRFLPPWVLAALACELVLAILVITLGSGSVLGSSFLVPMLMVAVFENEERTAFVAIVAVGLAILSGTVAGYASDTAYLYRIAIVAGAGVLGSVGAAFRARAVVARDQMEMLARISEIADGSANLHEALRRLTAALVPNAADLCELIMVAGDAPGRLEVSQAVGDPPLADRPIPDALVSAALSGQAVLARHLGRSEALYAALLGSAEVESLRAAGMASAIYAPVRAADTTLALLVLAVGPSGRRYGAADLRFAGTVGSRAGLAILNSQLLAELREARQRFEAIVESLADAVTIRDLSGRIIYANEAALGMLGMAPTESIRDRDPESLFGQYAVTDEFGEPLRMQDLPSVRLLAGEQPEPLLLRFVDAATGEEGWRVLKSTPLYDAQGDIEASVTIIEDVTASKRAERRSAFLSRVGDILASSLDYEQTLTNIAQLAVPEIADWCTVDLVDEQGGRQSVVVAHRDPSKVELARRLREYEPDELDPDQGLGYVLRTGEPLFYPSIPDELVERTAQNEEHLELLRSVKMRSAIVVPLHGGDRILGAMSLVFAESGRTFTTDDITFASQVAERAAVAVENARLYSERAQIAHTLQRSLLPDVLPDIDGWEIASLYRPARSDRGVEVGGDFYDVFRTESGWMVLIGDVTGKGVEAAAMTSLVRYGARFIGESVSDPAGVLLRLDRALRSQPALSLCTALCLHLEGSHITMASAGHPLPLLVTDDGVRQVGVGGPVLGAFEDCEWPTSALDLRPRETLVLYTDGVTDTVGEGDRFGERRVRATVAKCGAIAPGQLIACLDSALADFQTGPQADDTAALALRLTETAASTGAAHAATAAA